MNKQEIEAKINSLEERIMHFSHSMLNQLKEFKDNATTIQEDDQYTWEKCFKGKGWVLDINSDIFEDNGFDISKVNSHIAHSEKVVKSMRAMAMLSHIMAKANGDWVADWKDVDQEKYCIEVGDNGLDIMLNWTSYSFLTFKSEDIARAVLEQNRELILEFYQQG